MTSSEICGRAALTRWPDPPAGLGWNEGVDLDFLRRLVDHWRDHFDWRAQEVRLNGLAQYIATVDGEKIQRGWIDSEEDAGLSSDCSDGVSSSASGLRQPPNAHQPRRAGARSMDGRERPSDVESDQESLGARAPDLEIGAAPAAQHQRQSVRRAHLIPEERPQYGSGSGARASDRRRQRRPTSQASLALVRLRREEVSLNPTRGVR
jgi:hypothetical protein